LVWLKFQDLSDGKGLSLIIDGEDAKLGHFFKQVKGDRNINRYSANHICSWFYNKRNFVLGGVSLRLSFCGRNKFLNSSFPRTHVEVNVALFAL